MVGELGALGVENANNSPAWFTPVGDISFSFSLAVNAIITGLLVFKIVKASRALRNSLTRVQHRTLNDFRPLVSILIESGIALFAIQLVWVICFSTQSSGFYLVGGPIAMIYVCLIFLSFLSVSLNVLFFKGDYTDDYRCAGRHGTFL